MGSGNRSMSIIIFTLLSSVLILALFFYPANKDSFDLKELVTPITPEMSQAVFPLKGKGPRGNPPVPLSQVLDMLTPEDVLRVHDGKFKVAICMHDLHNDWSQLQLKGIRSILDPLNVQIVAVTDGEFSLDKQITDYQHVTRLKPDLIITIPLDTVKTSQVIKNAAEQGIKLVFMDSVPEGLNHPQHYSGVVLADSFVNAQVGAEALAEYIDRKGKVALIHWKNKMYTVDERSRGAREVFSLYPGITIASEKYFASLNDVAGLTRDILKEHPDIRGIWVVWDTPAMEVVKELRSQKKKIPVCTVDLGEEIAREIAQGDIVLATGAQHPYDQGVAEAVIAVVNLAGLVTPPYVSVPAERVTADSLEESWLRIFNYPLPTDILTKLQSNKTYRHSK